MGPTQHPAGAGAGGSLVPAAPPRGGGDRLRPRPRGFLWAFGVTGYRAITYGHVILSRVPLEGRLLRHELHHVAQYEVLGPLYLPTYVAVWLVRGYRGHPFEEEARIVAGESARAGRPDMLD